MSPKKSLELSALELSEFNLDGDNVDGNNEDDLAVEVFETKHNRLILPKISDSPKIYNKKSPKRPPEINIVEEFN